MLKINVLLVVLLLGGLISAPAAWCDSPDIGSPPPRFGLGVQNTFPSNGISGVMRLDGDISLQGIIDPFGILKTYSGRLLYGFNKEKEYELYVYGSVGAWSYSAFNITETALGFGGGVGIEWDWRNFRKTLPPIYWNAELGLGFAGFDVVGYSANTLWIGLGAHYRFN